MIQPPPAPPGGNVAAGFEGERFDYSKLLIEPPSAFEISQLVGPAPLKLTKLFDPDRAAATVWQGIAGGKDRRAIAKDLANVMNRDMVAARRVARTEGLRVATFSQLAVSHQLGDLILGHQVLATLDSRTRPEHRKRHGTIFYLHPKGSQKGYEDMPTPPIEADGTIAYNCVLPDQIVQGRFRSGFRARYTGKAAEIRLRSGIRLSVTVNHPVPTPHGSVAAGSLRPGDQVIAHRADLKRMNVRGNDYKTPASAEDTFRSLRASSLGVRVIAIPAFDFDGDERFFDGNIEVVKFNRLLRGNFDAASQQRANQNSLFNARSPRRAAVSLVPLGGSQPCRVSLLPTAFRRELGPLDPFGVRVAPQSNASLRESMIYDHAADAERFADLDRGFSSEIPLHDRFCTGPGRRVRVDVTAGTDGDASGNQLSPQGFAFRAKFAGKVVKGLSSNVPPCDFRKVSDSFCRRFGAASELDVRLFEFQPQGAEGYARFAGELIQRFPGQVSTDEVIEIRHFDFSGHVYDFETDVGYFGASSANGKIEGSMIIRNCRCMLCPVFADEPAPSVGYLLDTPYAAQAKANATASLAV